MGRGWEFVINGTCCASRRRGVTVMQKEIKFHAKIKVLFSVTLFRDVFLRTVLLGPIKFYGSKIPSSEDVYYTQFILSDIFVSALAAVAVRHDVRARYNIR